MFVERLCASAVKADLSGFGRCFRCFYKEQVVCAWRELVARELVVNLIEVLKNLAKTQFQMSLSKYQQ
jgi:hypothetical protein